MKKLQTLLLLFATFFALGTMAQNTAPGYRYASAQYEITSVDTAACVPGDPTINTFTAEFFFKFEVDASALITFTGGSVTPSTLTAAQLPYSLPGAVGVNFGEGSGSDALDGMIMEVSNGVAYINAEATRIYRLCDITSNFIDINFIDGPRSGLPGVGLSGDTDPGTSFDNRDANMELNLVIPVQDILTLEEYESPVSDVGNFTRRVVGRSTPSTIQLQATVDESVNLDGYLISPTSASDLFAGGSLEEAGITDLSLDLNTGVISFTTVGATAGRYPLQIIALDDRGGATTNDFIVELIPTCNSIPSFVDVGNVTATGGTSDPSTVYYVPIGTPLTLNVEVAPDDPNAVDVLVQTSSLPAGATFSENAGNPGNYEFTWTPNATDPNVNLTVYATDIDANGDKICESAEIRYNIVPVPPCPTPLLTPSISYSDQNGSPTNCYDASAGDVIDVSVVVGGFSLYSYVWEYVDDQGVNANAAIVGNTASLDDITPPAGYETIRVTITDENLNGCVYGPVDIPIGFCASPCDASITVNNCATFGDPNTFYKGYSTGMELTAIPSSNATGNSKPIWTTGDTTISISVMPTATTTYGVTFTDDNGVVCTATVTINYENLRCGGNCNPIVQNNGGNHGSSDDDDDGGSSDDDDDGSNKRGGSSDDDDDGGSSDDDDDGGNCNNNNNKVTICHIPPGNPGNAHNIKVSQNALAAHLAHGDILGGCPPDPCEAIKYRKSCKITLCKTSGWCAPKTVCVKAKWADYLIGTGNYSLDACSGNKTEVIDMVDQLMVSPNPSMNGKFIMSYNLVEASDLEITIVDFMGKVVYQSNEHNAAGFYEDVINLSERPAGMYIMTVRAFDETWTEKLQILK